MLQGEHSAILLTYIKLPFDNKIFVLSMCEWLFYTAFTVVAVLIGVTIDAHFDYHDSITITETTIMILSVSWHTIMILS